MKNGQRFRWVLVIAFMVAISLGYLVTRAAGPPSEPVWRGYRLSDWLIAYDSAAPAPAGSQLPRGTRRPPDTTSQEIEEALDGIGEKALPLLRYWLTARPGRLTRSVNRLLEQQQWTEFRFPDKHYYRILARTGFEAYNATAQPLLPELLELTESPNQENRMWAFQAAFLTLPDRNTFMDLFDRTRLPANAPIHRLAVHWLWQRFPDEAEGAGVGDRDSNSLIIPPSFERDSFVIPPLTDGANPFAPDL